MPDITKCTNKTCELKDKCYRWTSEGNPYRQSYTCFEPKKGKCKYFMKDERKTGL